MTHTIEIQFNDLTAEKQEEIIETLKTSLYEEVKAEGEKLLQRDWYDPKPKSWEEAWIRENYVNEIMWGDYERKHKDAEIPQPHDWREWLDDHLTEYVEKQAQEAMHYHAVEI
jgi:hypothetical protein